MPHSNHRPYIQRAKIICGFPGIGKSFFCKPGTEYPASFGGFPAVDLESMAFKFDTAPDGSNSIVPGWEENYMSYVRHRASQPGVLLLTSHESTKQGLIKNGLAFTCIYPLKELKEEYRRRYTERGSHIMMINAVMKNWDIFLNEFMALRGCDHIQLEKGQFLATRIDEVMGEYDYHTAARLGYYKSSDTDGVVSKAGSERVCTNSPDDNSFQFNLAAVLSGTKTLLLLLILLSFLTLSLAVQLCRSYKEESLWLSANGMSAHKIWTYNKVAAFIDGYEVWAALQNTTATKQ